MAKVDRNQSFTTNDSIKRGNITPVETGNVNGDSTDNQNNQQPPQQTSSRQESAPQPKTSDQGPGQKYATSQQSSGQTPKSDDEMICSKKKLVKTGWILYFVYCMLFSIFGLVILLEPVVLYNDMKLSPNSGDSVTESYMESSSKTCITSTALLVCVAFTFGGAVLSFFCPFVMKKNTLCGFAGLTFGIILIVGGNIAGFVVSRDDPSNADCSAWALAYLYAGGGVNMVVCCGTYALVAVKYCSKQICKSADVDV